MLIYRYMVNCNFTDWARYVNALPHSVLFLMKSIIPHSVLSLEQMDICHITELRVFYFHLSDACKVQFLHNLLLMKKIYILR